MDIATTLSVGGMTLALIGSVVASWAVFISPKDAERIGGGAWGGNFELPKAMVRQSRFAAAGLALVALGTFLQIVGTVLD